MSEHERIHEQPKGENSRSSVTEMVLYRPNVTLLIAGQIFLFAALMLFGIAGYSLYRIAEMGPSIEVLGDAEGMTTRDIYNFYGRILSVFLSPLMLIASAFVCTLVGMRLLRAVGAVAQGIIPPREYDLLAPAVRDGNEKAIAEYVKLSSLTGVTGTFTKVELTGLPLATIVLTIILAILGVYNPKFFDLAQLTLGAFIGSYVQKRREEAGGLTMPSSGRS